MNPQVKKALELLKLSPEDELSLPTAVDRIEVISSDPAIVRKTLEQAEIRGVISRREGSVWMNNSVDFDFETDVVRKECDCNCRRCGSSLTTAYYIKTGTKELGPFGPQCVRRVLGRD